MSSIRRKRGLSQLRAEVVTHRGEDGIDRIAFAVGEIIAIHAVLVLDVTDDRLDGGPPLHFALDGSRDAVLLA